MFKKEDVKFETTKSRGPGGQNVNKRDTCVVATHIPTGLKVTVSDRKQGQNKRKALKILEQRYNEKIYDKKALDKKQRRDYNVRNETIIRTYHFKRNEVKDHRSGKTANLTKMLEGKVNLKELSCN